MSEKSNNVPFLKRSLSELKNIVLRNFHKENHQDSQNQDVDYDYVYVDHCDVPDAEVANSLIDSIRVKTNKISEKKIIENPRRKIEFPAMFTDKKSYSSCESTGEELGNDLTENEFEENRLQVEATVDELIYEAYVEDVSPKGIEVSFENKSKCILPFNAIRFPVKTSSLPNTFAVGDTVDFKRNISHPYWQRGVLQRRLEGNLWKARLAGTADKFFSVDCIRKVNTNPPFDGNTLKKFEIGIPEKLNNVAKKHGIHEEFRKHISADICRYILEKNVLRIISREAEITSKQITILKNMHIKHLERKSHESEPNLFVEEFTVQNRFIGLAIGKNCSNLKNVQKLKDVTEVKWFKNSNRFRVKGKTSEAVKTARDKIEYYEERLVIPVHEAEGMVANDGKIIEDIIEESGLVRLEVGDDSVTNETAAIPFAFVGTRRTINEARRMFDYELACLRNENLRKCGTYGSVSDCESNTKKLENKEFTEEFFVEEKFMGLAIGKKGCNLQAAKRIKNVTKVELISGTRKFVISGKTLEAVKEAKNMIQFTEKEIFLPECEAEDITSYGEEYINDIVSDCGLVRIEIGESTMRNDQLSVPFTFVGTNSSIKKALKYFSSKDRVKLKNKPRNSLPDAKTSSDSQLTDCYIETFTVKKHLLGLAIGKGGVNIRKAEKLAGIISIKAESESFVITGKDEESVKNARRILEYAESVIQIDHRHVGRLIGYKFGNLHSIEQQYGNVRILMEKKDKNSLPSTEPVKFTVIGPVCNVNDAMQRLTASLIGSAGE